MIIVTGGAGFIGCNLIKGLNAQGRDDILVVDDLTDGRKYRNLAAVRIADYLDYEDFLARLSNRHGLPSGVDVVFHQGACSTTTEWDGRYMMRNNFDYSKQLLAFCQQQGVPLIYASSAAVYGRDQSFDDQAKFQVPLNVYGYSKWLFDQYVLNMRSRLSTQVVGLRYFNVFGPHEQHKGSMASVAFHWMHQLAINNELKCFAGSDGYADGEQVRDFVYVEDAVKVNLWFWQHASVSGIFNCGTGQARSFNDLAQTLIRLRGSGHIRYIPFPEHLKGSYQSFTEANIGALRAAGFNEPFHTLEQGLAKYYQWFQAQQQAQAASQQQPLLT